MLRLCDINEKKHEILDGLTVFLNKNDIFKLSEAVGHLETTGGGCQIAERDFPMVRKTLAELWVRTFASVEKKYDRNSDYDTDPPAINVVAPYPYPAGIAPSSIVEDDLRGKYEKAIAANKGKLKIFNFNLDVQRYRNEVLFMAEKILVPLYGRKPFNMEELQEMFQNSSGKYWVHFCRWKNEAFQSILFSEEDGASLDGGGLRPPRGVPASVGLRLRVAARGSSVGFFAVSAAFRGKTRGFACHFAPTRSRKGFTCGSFFEKMVGHASLTQTAFPLTQTASLQEEVVVLAADPNRRRTRSLRC